MRNCKTGQRQRILFSFAVICFLTVALTGRLSYLMLVKADYYGKKAEQVQQRERAIKAERGKIYDRNGTVIAGNKPVSTISVIHNQITDKERVIRVLSRLLELDEEKVRARVEKQSSREKIKTNVEKKVSDKIRKMNLDGVMVDEDYKRYYPYNELASKVIGFAGGDNQGILGLEVKYDANLSGQDGSILTTTNARGIEIDGAVENRIEPVAGDNLYCSLDVNLQKFAEQAAKKVMKSKNAKNVRIIMMNPSNGEIYAMVNVPEFDLNNPYELNTDEKVSDKKKQELLNQMWRNHCVSDTYEPGSTFKIITATSALEANVVKLTDTFSCPGFKVVEDRRIRCHKTTGHGSQNFMEATMNSCNPVFITVGLRLGVENYYHYFKQFGLMEKTGVDLPGEAGTIMHKMEDMKAVELATVSFGQSFQISPLQLATTAASIINGGNRVTPHFGIASADRSQTKIEKFSYPVKEQIVSEETSETMRMILEQVVENGTGKNGYVEGARVGGKTATSQTLPRGSGRYIASFVGFAPADDPQVLALAVIHNPQGVYYGGQVAAPVVRQLFENILPYLEKMDYN